MVTPRIVCVRCSSIRDYRTFKTIVPIAKNLSRFFKFLEIFPEFEVLKGKPLVHSTQGTEDLTRRSGRTAVALSFRQIWISFRDRAADSENSDRPERQNRGSLPRQDRRTKASHRTL